MKHWAYQTANKIKFPNPLDLGTCGGRVAHGEDTGDITRFV